MTVKIYHNPRCSKSRQTLQLLQDKGIKPEIIDYLKAPPTAAELIDLLGKLGMEPREVMRKGESEYKSNNLANPDLTRETLIASIANNPILLERPIVVANNKAVIGRPPENILTIL
jgi:arsenate reductase (glutaredoxin)